MRAGARATAEDAWRARMRPSSYRPLWYRPLWWMRPSEFVGRAATVASGDEDADATSGLAGRAGARLFARWLSARGLAVPAYLGCES